MSGGEQTDLDARLEMSRRALEQLEAERERLEGLLLRLPSLLAELDPDRLAEGVAEAARQLVGARFALFLPAGRERATLTFAGLTRNDFAEVPAVGRAPVLAGVLWAEHAVRIDDVATWAQGEEAARVYGVLADGRLVRSWLAVPVLGRTGRVLAALYLGHHRAHAFTPRHEELVEGLAHQLGVALEHAALFSERTRVAAALQETLLPPLLPDIPGADMAARYRATGAGNLVGGDFYDIFEVMPGTWGLVLGDVAGFGPEAAALTGVARYTVRAIASAVQGPADVLAELNDAVLRQASSDRFLTAIFASIEPQPDHLAVTLAIGGHPPPLVLRDDESLEWVDDSSGVLLGVFPEVALVNQRLVLHPGDAVVLYTDGVIEARNETGEEFGLERLSELLATCGGRSAEGIARRIERSVLDHRGERTEDDVAIVVLRAEPK
ncbi:MAG: SpoIIE family protein phosphatase [Actinomycetota bacterium]|nr:SpoIIE family protein phosphatase [Actinomycetota bacterium]